MRYRLRAFISAEGVLISHLGAAPSHSPPTPSVWVDSNPHALVTNPNALGGEQVNLTAFVRVLLNKG